MQDLKTLESDVAELGDSIGADALGQEIDTLEEKIGVNRRISSFTRFLG